MVFEHAPIAKVLIGLDGRFELVNPDDQAADLAATAAATAGEQDSYAMDKRYRTSSGATVWGAKSATLMRGDDGPPPRHFIAQIQDITARKHGEQALLDERRRLRDAESLGRVGSWERDLDTDAIYFSAGLFELWGIDPESFDGDYDSTRAQIHPDDRPALDAAVGGCGHRLD